jgi:hypothetical protein
VTSSFLNKSLLATSIILVPGKATKVAGKAKARFKLQAIAAITQEKKNGAKRELNPRPVYTPTSALTN